MASLLRAGARWAEQAYNRGDLITIPNNHTYAVVQSLIQGQDLLLLYIVWMTAASTRIVFEPGLTLGVGVVLNGAVIMVKGSTY